MTVQTVQVIDRIRGGCLFLQFKLLKTNYRMRSKILIESLKCIFIFIFFAEDEDSNVCVLFYSDQYAMTILIFFAHVDKLKRVVTVF